MWRGFSEVLRGINGTVELNRLSLFMGALGYVLGTIAFQAWAMRNGQDFDVTAFCLAFGGGFAGLGLGGAGAIAIKDRNVASAKVIEATGSKPSTPRAPAQPELAETASDELPEYAR